MSEYLKNPEESRAIADRRAFPRIQVRSLAYIELDDGNGGLILNISEGGIAVQAAELLVGESFGSMRFRLPKAQNWIQTAGKIAWQGRSRKEAGIKFVDLPGDTQRQIHDWIYSAAFSPNLLTEKGRFKILWEAESPGSESGIREPATSGVPSEFDAIFPSEQSLPPAPAFNAPEARLANTGAEAGSQELASREPGGYPEPRADETSAKIPLGVEDELSGARRIAIAPDESPRSIPAAERAHETLPQTESKESGEIPLLPRSPADVRRYGNPFATTDAPSKRAYGTPFSEYHEEEVADARPQSRKTHILTGVLCFAAGLALALLIVTGPSGLKNRFVQFYKVKLAPLASVVNPSPASAPPSPTPSASEPPKAASDSTQQPTSTAAPLTPGAPQQETSPAPKSGAAAANAPAEQTGQGSVNAPGLSESSALRPPSTNELPAAPGKQHAGENERSSLSAPPVNQVLASPSRENPLQSEQTLDAYAQPVQKAPVSPVVNEPPPIENVQASAAQPPLPLSARREPEIPVGTAAISSHFHSVRNAPVSDPEAPAPILRIGQLASIRQPVYPPEAAKRRIEGVVKLRAAVAQNGVVESVELVSGPPGLVAAAIDAVRDWRYAPTLLNERPVEALEDITVVFRLANSTPSPR